MKKIKEVHVERSDEVGEIRSDEVAHFGEEVLCY
jgi:hypothetical protein